MTPPADRFARLRELAFELADILAALDAAEALASEVEEIGPERPQQARWDVVVSYTRAFRAAMEGTT